MLTMESTLIRLDELKPEKVDGIRKAAKAKLLEVAEKAMGAEARLVIRDLLASDLGETYHEFPPVTGVDNTWTSILTAGAVAVADNVFIAIVGVRIIENGAPFAVDPGVSAMRITSGGSYVALWDLYKLQVLAGAATAAGTSVFLPVAAITEGPIIISQNIAFNIETFGLETTDTILAIEGYVCEKEGQNLKP